MTTRQFIRNINEHPDRLRVGAGGDEPPVSGGLHGAITYRAGITWRFLGGGKDQQLLLSQGPGKNVRWH